MTEAAAPVGDRMDVGECRPAPPAAGRGRLTPDTEGLLASMESDAATGALVSAAAADDEVAAATGAAAAAATPYSSRIAAPDADGMAHSGDWLRSISSAASTTRLPAVFSSSATSMNDFVSISSW